MGSRTVGVNHFHALETGNSTRVPLCLKISEGSLRKSLSRKIVSVRDLSFFAMS